MTRNAVRRGAAEVPLTAAQQAHFARVFGMEWALAVRLGLVWNAAEAVRRCGEVFVTRAWDAAERRAVLSPDLHVAYLASRGVYVMNGFYYYLSVRLAGPLRWFHLRFDPARLSWQELCTRVVGRVTPETQRDGANSLSSLGHPSSTNRGGALLPTTAGDDGCKVSLHDWLTTHWYHYGLDGPPQSRVREIGVSDSPWSAMLLRCRLRACVIPSTQMTWTTLVSRDELGRVLVEYGIDPAWLASLVRDNPVLYDCNEPLCDARPVWERLCLAEPPQETTVETEQQHRKQQKQQQQQLQLQQEHTYKPRLESVRALWAQLRLWQQRESLHVLPPTTVYVLSSAALAMSESDESWRQQIVSSALCPARERAADVPTMRVAGTQVEEPKASASTTRMSESHRESVEQRCEWGVPRDCPDCADSAIRLDRHVSREIEQENRPGADVLSVSDTWSATEAATEMAVITFCPALLVPHVYDTRPKSNKHQHYRGDGSGCNKHDVHDTLTRQHSTNNDHNHNKNDNDNTHVSGVRHNCHAMHRDTMETHYTDSEWASLAWSLIRERLSRFHGVRVTLTHVHDHAHRPTPLSSTSTTTTCPTASWFDAYFPRQSRAAAAASYLSTRPFPTRTTRAMPAEPPVRWGKQARRRFVRLFGVSPASVRMYPAESCMQRWGLSAWALERLWESCFPVGPVLPGVYVGKVATDDVYIVNGFVPAARARFDAHAHRIFVMVLHWPREPHSAVMAASHEEAKHHGNFLEQRCGNKKYVEDDVMRIRSRHTKGSLKSIHTSYRASRNSANGGELWDSNTDQSTTAYLTYRQLIAEVMGRGDGGEVCGARGRDGRTGADGVRHDFFCTIRCPPSRQRRRRRRRRRGGRFDRGAVMRGTRTRITRTRRCRATRGLCTCPCRSAQTVQQSRRRCTVMRVYIHCYCGAEVAWGGDGSVRSCPVCRSAADPSLPPPTRLCGCNFRSPAAFCVSPLGGTHCIQTTHSALLTHVLLLRPRTMAHVFARVRMQRPQRTRQQTHRVG